MTIDKERSGRTTIYNIGFSNLTDLYEYIKSDPTVNTKVFRIQSSLKEDSSFYGEPLDKAVEYCLGGYKRDFDNFLKTSGELKKIGVEEAESRTLTRSLYGGIPLAPLVAAGVPDCMLRYERDKNVKHVTIYFNLGYPSCTLEEEIINRGLATLYIIQALENKGYIVNFKAFELSRCGNEIVNINVNLKKPGDLFLNIEKCYFPIKAKEFLRRILFRVLESVPVEDLEWGHGYGEATSIKEMKKFFATKSTDLIISYPEEMGVEGYNIYDDTLRMIRKLKIQDELDTQRVKTLSKRYREQNYS